jgi:hypothetical protein
MRRGSKLNALSGEKPPRMSTVPAAVSITVCSADHMSEVLAFRPGESAG